jgi:RsiW-degrading membrane proteinase PrsW (M82 family)
MLPSAQTIGYAVIGGILPSLVWLYFLLKEDAKHPEPKAMIALAFVAGMLAVPLVLPIENAASLHLAGTPLLIAWATTEEVMKYLAAALFVLWRRSVDEAPDYVIYMLTVALGFAAAENMLFLVAPLSAGNLISGVITDNLRFIGSTLLHVVASSAIGFAMAFSWKMPPYIRMLYAALGLILAIALHTAFNALIISGDGSSAFVAFFIVWCAAVGFFALFEVVKYFGYHAPPTHSTL